jgi:hypothetical protein
MGKKEGERKGGETKREWRERERGSRRKREKGRKMEDNKREMGKKEGGRRMAENKRGMGMKEGGRKGEEVGERERKGRRKREREQNVHQMHSSCLDHVKRFREFITIQCSKLECLSVPNIFKRDLFGKGLPLNGRSLPHSQTLGLTGESNKNTLAYYTALLSNIRLDWINLSAQNTLAYYTV